MKSPLGLLFLALALFPIQVSAAPSRAAYCDTFADTFRDNWEINSSEPMLHDRASLPQNAKATIADLKRVSACTPGDARDYAAAYDFGLMAAQLHAMNPSVDDWKAQMNLANQLLEKCVTRHYGTGEGAQCQTDLETNIHRKVAWSSAS